MIAQGRCHVKSTEDHYSMPPVSRQTKHHTFIDGGSTPPPWHTTTPAHSPAIGLAMPVHLVTQKRRKPRLGNRHVLCNAIYLSAWPDFQPGKLCHSSHWKVFAYSIIQFRIDTKISKVHGEQWVKQSDTKLNILHFNSLIVCTSIIGQSFKSL